MEQKFGHMINGVHDGVRVLSRRLVDIEEGLRTGVPLANDSKSFPS